MAATPYGRTALVALVLAVPLGRGLFRLGTPDIWIDEAATWQGVSGTWRQLLEHALAGDDCGGFFYALVLKPWTELAGVSEAALRLPSVLFTVLLAAVVFLLGRRLFSRRAGLYAALAIGLYPVVFLQSRQARCYALELLLFALVLLGLVLLLEERRRWGAGLLAAAGSLLVVTHVFGIVALSGVAAVAIVAPFDRHDGVQRPAEVAAANLRPLILPVLVLASWLALLWPEIERSRTEFWLHGSLARTYLSLVEYVVPVVVAAVVLLWEGRVEGGRSRHRLVTAATLLTLPILAGPYLASLASRGEHHFVLERYFLPLAVVGALALGFLLARLPRPLAVAVATVLLLASFLKPGNRAAYTDVSAHGARNEELAAYLTRHRQPGEPVLIVPGYGHRVLAYYGVDAVPAGTPSCEELTARLAAVVRSGVGSGTAWVVHPGCDLEGLPRSLGHVVSRRSFGSRSLARIVVTPAAGLPGDGEARSRRRVPIDPAAGGSGPGSEGTRGRRMAGRRTLGARGRGNGWGARPPGGRGGGPRS